jgi:hypothetical protein
LDARSRIDPFARTWRLACLALCALSGALISPAVRADELASALYVRTDSDSTTVVSPRARARHDLNEETDIEATYAVDVWSSASIDIRTSASVHAVTEQRDELDLGVTHELEDLSLHAGYRLSIENDYDSNGLSASAAYSVADNAATFALAVSAIHDAVGRSGDDDFSRRLDTINSRLSFTQVIDADTFFDLTYELAVLDGYQASPYRYVGVGGTGYGCERATYCLPERVPSTRLRHAFAVSVRRALTEAVSLGLTYRYYLDDWALDSHTAVADLGWNAGERTLLTMHFRYYTQSQVDFYQTRYAALPDANASFTHDRELSSLSAERLGLDFTQRFPIGDGEQVLSLSVDLAGALFQYDDFIGLTSVQALEVTTAAVLAL